MIHKYDLRSQDFFNDPYPVWERMRNDDPAYFHPEIGMWFLTRYEDVRQLQDDSRFRVEDFDVVFDRVSADRAERRDALKSFYSVWTHMVDGPRHRLLRSLVSQALTARVINDLRPFIRTWVTEKIDMMREEGKADFLADFAVPLAFEVVCGVIGMPADEFPVLKAWTESVIEVFTVPPDLDASVDKAYAATCEMKEYFYPTIAKLRRDPGEDFQSGIVHAKVDGISLSDEEIVSTFALMLVGGNETTRKFMCNALIALGEHPDEFRTLENPSPRAMQMAIEELMRYDGTAAFYIRQPRVEVELGGVTIGTGEKLFGVLNAANRDPKVFDRPDALDLDRPNSNKHMGFGQGMHYCIGAALGRAEVSIAMEALAKELPRLEIPSAEDVTWEQCLTLRGPTTVPISFG